MIGKRFGKLTVIASAGKRRNGSCLTPAWLCRCDCGRDRIVAGTELRRGRVSHCDRNRFVPRHGEYISYSAMKARCYQRGNKEFENYGGRGIEVCHRWLRGEACETGFECFLRDMGPRPLKHSLERINPNGNYEPTNCKWAPSQEQVRNRRNTRMIVVLGVEMPFAQAAQEHGIPYSVLIDRVDRYGWTPERALSEPVRQIKRRDPVYAGKER